MATNFPTSQDSFTNPTSSDTLDSPDHAAQHANVNDAVEALQAKVGSDSSAVTTSHDYKIAQLEGKSPTITLAGDASGSVTLTNLGNGTLTVAVNDDSHNHTIANVDNLQTTLDGKAASSHSHSYLPLSGGTLTGALTLGGDLNYSNKAIIANNASSTNIDHIWHDDGGNTWHFCSDTSYKATGNSTLRAGTVTVSTANATTVNLNTSVHLTNVDADGSMRVQGNNGYIDIGPKNSTYCHVYTDRGSFYFNKSTLYANSTSNKIWHRGDLKGAAVSVSMNSSGYGSLLHGLGTTPDWAFIGARTTTSSGNDNQLAFPIVSANSTTLNFRGYEIDTSGNSGATVSTIYNATVYVYYVAGNQ